MGMRGAPWERRVYKSLLFLIHAPRTLMNLELTDFQNLDTLNQNGDLKLKTYSFFPQSFIHTRTTTDMALSERQIASFLDDKLKALHGKAQVHNEGAQWSKRGDDKGSFSLEFDGDQISLFAGRELDNMYRSIELITHVRGDALQALQIMVYIEFGGQTYNNSIVKALDGFDNAGGHWYEDDTVLPDDDVSLFGRLVPHPSDADKVDYVFPMHAIESGPLHTLCERLELHTGMTGLRDMLVADLAEARSHCALVSRNGKLVCDQAVLAARARARVNALLSAAVCYNRWRKRVVERTYHPKRLCQRGYFDL